MSYGVGHRRALDPELRGRGVRPTATALIRPLAWEPLYATGVSLKKTKNKNKKLWVQVPAWVLATFRSFVSFTFIFSVIVLALACIRCC